MSQHPKRRPQPWILGGLAVLALLCGGFLAIGALSDNDGTEPVGTPAQTATTAAAKGPAPADFTITAKITEKTCYGDAGCAVTWVPELTYTGPAIADGQTWLVRYAVSGVESGNKAGTVVVDSSGPAKQSAKHGRTAAEDSAITLKVTGIERDG